MEGFPWDDLRKILHEGQTMAKVHTGEEIAGIPWIVHERADRQTTDRRICDSKDTNVR